MSGPAASRAGVSVNQSARAASKEGVSKWSRRTRETTNLEDQPVNPVIRYWSIVISFVYLGLIARNEITKYHRICSSLVVSMKVITVPHSAGPLCAPSRDGVGKSA